MIEIKSEKQKKYYLSLLSDICIAIERFDKKKERKKDDKKRYNKNKDIPKGVLFFNINEDLEVKDLVNDILN
jgi:hypothetical protein